MKGNRIYKEGGKGIYTNFYKKCIFAGSTGAFYEENTLVVNYLSSILPFLPSFSTFQILC